MGDGDVVYVWLYIKVNWWFFRPSSVPSVSGLYDRKSPYHCSRIFPVLRSALNQSPRNKEFCIARTHCLNLQVHVGVCVYDALGGEHDLAPCWSVQPTSLCTWVPHFVLLKSIDCTFVVSPFLSCIVFVQVNTKMYSSHFYLCSWRNKSDDEMLQRFSTRHLQHIHVPTFVRQFLWFSREESHNENEFQVWERVDENKAQFPWN